jgi:hypothetical protein
MTANWIMTWTAPNSDFAPDYHNGHMRRIAFGTGTLTADIGTLTDAGPESIALESLSPSAQVTCVW